MAAVSFGASKLEQLRLEARRRGCEWLSSTMHDIKPDELRALAQAAGLRVRRDDKAWMSAGELREALVLHLAPERSSAPEEFTGLFLFCFIVHSHHVIRSLLTEWVVEFVFYNG